MSCFLFELFSRRKVRQNNPRKRQKLRTTKFDGDINIPEIGAGLGNGNFQIIQEIILSHLTPNFEEETGNEVVFWKYN